MTSLQMALMAYTLISPPTGSLLAPLTRTGKASKFSAIATTCSSSPVLNLVKSTPASALGTIKTLNRVNGRYYETALHAALNIRPELITITSFNDDNGTRDVDREGGGALEDNHPRVL